MKRIPPSGKLRQEFEGVLQGYGGKEHPLDAFIRLAARYMLQAALEQEVEDFLGRAHYKRGKRKHQEWRNGYEEGKVTTAEGLLEVALPRVRETEEPFHSHLSPLLKEGSNALGQMVTEMYVRGLSTIFK